jgi:hypothetical protein
MRNNQAVYNEITGFQFTPLNRAASPLVLAVSEAAELLRTKGKAVTFFARTEGTSRKLAKGGKKDFPMDPSDKLYDRLQPEAKERVLEEVKRILADQQATRKNLKKNTDHKRS